MMHRALTASLLFMLTTASAVHAQTIIGRAVDAATRQPLALAEVKLLRPGEAVVVARATTDSAGSFRLRAPLPGRYVIEASLIGYGAVRGQEIDVGDGREVQIELLLSETPIALEPIRVVAEREQEYRRIDEFYDRLATTRETSMGWILTRAEIEAMGLPYVKDYVKNPVCAAGECWSQVTSRCRAETYVNAVPATLTDVNMILEVDDLEGVEFYEGPRVPPLYRRSLVPPSPCAVVLFWTRPGRTIGSPITLKRVGIALGALGVILLIAR